MNIRWQRGRRWQDSQAVRREQCVVGSGVSRSAARLRDGRVLWAAPARRGKPDGGSRVCGVFFPSKHCVGLEAVSSQNGRIHTAVFQRCGWGRGVCAQVCWATFSARGSLRLGLPVPCVLPVLLQLSSGGKLKYLILSVLKAYKRDYSSKVSVLTRRDVRCCEPNKPESWL